MGTFDITRARQRLGITPATAVRGDVRVGTLPEGAAIGQALVGGLKLGLGILQRRQQMQDTRSAIEADSLINTAITKNEAFREFEPDTTIWSKDLQERLNIAQGEMDTLKMSKEARSLANARFQAGSRDAFANSLVAETRREADDTREALVLNVTNAVASGDPQKIIEAKKQFINASPVLYRDDAEAKNVLSIAIQAGQKVRNDRAVAAKRSEAGIFPELVEQQMKDERELRATGKVSPELADLTGEDLVEIGNFAERESIERLDALQRKTGIDIVTKYWDNELTNDDLKTALDIGGMSPEKFDKWKKRLATPAALVTDPAANALARQSVIDASRGVLTFSEASEQIQDLADKLNATDGKQIIEDLQTGFARAQSEKVNEWLTNGRAIMSPRFRDPTDPFGIEAILAFGEEDRDEQRRIFDAESSLRESYEIALNQWFSLESRRRGADDPVPLKDITDFSLRLRNSYQQLSRNLEVDALEAAAREETQKQLARPRVTNQPLPIEQPSDLPDIPASREDRLKELEQLKEARKKKL